MEFSTELIYKLENIWQKRGYITISGISSLGKPFTTTGRITTTDYGKMGVDAEMQTIFLEYGKSKVSPSRKQTRYFAPFTAKETKDCCALYIFEIRYEDIVIYKNNDQTLIEESVNHVVTAKNNELEKEGRDVILSCPVVGRLKNMTGKPIVLDGHCGVLVGIKGSTYLGNPMVDMFVGPGRVGVFVKENSVLYTEDNKGVFHFLAENDKKEYNENLKPIVERINRKQTIK